MYRPIHLVIIISLYCNAVLVSSLSWREEETKRPRSTRHDIGKDSDGKHDADDYPSHGEFIVLPAQSSEHGIEKQISVAKHNIPESVKRGYVLWYKAIHDATDKNFRGLLQLLGKSGRHNAGGVYIPIKFYMKDSALSTRMIDSISVTRYLSLCIRKVYLVMQKYYWTGHLDPWDGVIYTDEIDVRLVGQISENYNVNNSEKTVDDFSIQNGCQLDYGSINRMPSIGSCIIDSNSTTNKTVQRYTSPTGRRCDAQSHVVFAVNSTLLCSGSQTTTIIAYFKSAWMLAKINYGLILSTTLCVLLPTLYERIDQHHRYKSHLGFIFGVLNIFWMTWGLQETLHWDTKWQDNIPYICVATNTIRYLVEGTVLFLFAWISLERYQAIARPLVTNLSGRKNKLTFVVIITGIFVGGVYSILHIVALFTISGTPTLLKTCHIQNNVSGSLVPLIVVKVISLVAMYLVPCTIMSTANIAMFRSVKRTSKQKLVRCHSKEQTKNKATRISNFLVFSSVCMVCCVSKPIFEAYVAAKIHVGASALGKDISIGVLLDSIIWNLTTVAFTINTVLGLLYTK